jgi:integrase/recombinase XerD
VGKRQTLTTTRPTWRSRIQKDYPTDRSTSYEEMNLAVDDSTYDTVSRLRSYLNNRWRDSEALSPSRQADRMTTESVRRVIRSLTVEADVRPQSIEGGQATLRT